jgi:hypothetical protein
MSKEVEAGDERELGNDPGLRDSEDVAGEWICKRTSVRVATRGRGYMKLEGSMRVGHVLRVQDAVASVNAATGG